MSSSPDSPASGPLPTRTKPAAGSGGHEVGGGVDALPSRIPQARQGGGRHRRPEAPEVPQGAPPLVLAVAGAADSAELAAVVSEVSLLARSGANGLDVRPLFLDGHVALGDVLRAPTPWVVTDEPDTDGAPEEAAQPAVSAIVVPLLLGPDPAAQARVTALATQAAEADGRTSIVTEPLGPHPLLAEALHERLSEAGLARADRARLFTVVTAADGIVLGVTGGPTAVQAADVTGVLLAARLALPVVVADLGVPGAVARTAEQLRAMGAQRIALAPYVLGPDAAEGLDIEASAAEAEATAADAIGAHAAVGKLVLTRYLEALAGVTESADAAGAPGEE